MHAQHNTHTHTRTHIQSEWYAPDAVHYEHVAIVALAVESDHTRHPQALEDWYVLLGAQCVRTGGDLTTPITNTASLTKTAAANSKQ